VCRIICDDGTVYSILASIRAKLIEVNERLLLDPQLVVDKVHLFLCAFLTFNCFVCWHTVYQHKQLRWFLGCIKCTRCYCYRCSQCLSVCLSLGLNWQWRTQCMPRAVCVGSFSAAFAKCLWPLVVLYVC